VLNAADAEMAEFEKQRLEEKLDKMLLENELENEDRTSLSHTQGKQLCFD